MNARPPSRAAASAGLIRPYAGGRHRLAVASRAVAAILGGYALAAFFSTTVALLSRAPREEAIHLGSVPSFLLFAGAIIWAFTARTAARAWTGIALPTLVLAAITWGLIPGIAP